MRRLFCLASLLSLSLAAGCAAAEPVTDGAVDLDADALDDDAGIDEGDAAVERDATIDDGAVPADARGDAAVPDADVAPACTGTAPTCYGRDALGCSIGLGCTSTFRCLGFAARCIEQGTAADCGAVAGCAWNDATDRCTGAQRGCATYDDATSCETQPGCVEGAVCTGTITPCDGLDEATCETQIGCGWTGAPAT